MVSNMRLLIARIRRERLKRSGCADCEMKSVAELSVEKGDIALPENESVTPENLVVYRKGLKQGQVREGVSW